MIITNKTLEGALLEASKELGCSVAEIDYELITMPRKGFLGLFSKPASIKIKQTSDVVEEEKALPAMVNVHIAKAARLSQEELDRCSKEILDLLSMCDDVTINCSQLECGSIQIDINSANEFSILGRDNFKYASLDLLLNHYTNINYNLHARVNVNGCLEPMIEELQKQLDELKEQININSKGGSEVLVPTLLNIAYEQLASEYPHKIINIKENQHGRYIYIWGKYDEHHRTSCKRKH